MPLPTPNAGESQDITTTDRAPSFTASVQDRASYAISRREVTDNGYLKVPGRVARAGVQKYLASELGLTGRSPMDIVGVLRPAEEVFSDASLASYADSDVTIEHPGNMVDVVTWRGVAVGHVTDRAVRDGDYVEATMIIKDADAIKAIESGKIELSAGYLAEYVPLAGIADSGEEYEFIQKNIRINHVALVSSARAGREARLYDQKPQEAITMTHPVTLDSGTQVEVADKATATLIANTIDGLRKQANDAADKLKQATADKDAAQAKVDKLSEDNEALKAQTSDAAIQERVKAIYGVQTQAVKLVGDSFKCESLDSVEIKRAAMAIFKPNREWADKSSAYVEYAFDDAMAEKEEKEKEENDGKKAAKDSTNQFAADLSKATADSGSPQATRDAARHEFLAKRYNQEAK